MTGAEQSIIDAHCEAETVLLKEITRCATAAPSRCEQLAHAYALLHEARPPRVPGRVDAA